jgi:hypothetical protein
MLERPPPLVPPHKGEGEQCDHTASVFSSLICAAASLYLYRKLQFRNFNTDATVYPKYNALLKRATD